MRAQITAASFFLDSVSKIKPRVKVRVRGWGIATGLVSRVN